MTLETIFHWQNMFFGGNRNFMPDSQGDTFRRPSNRKFSPACDAMNGRQKLVSYLMETSNTITSAQTYYTCRLHANKVSTPTMTCVKRIANEPLTTHKFQHMRQAVSEMKGDAHAGTCRSKYSVLNWDKIVASFSKQVPNLVTSGWDILELVTGNNHDALTWYVLPTRLTHHWDKWDL